MTPQLTGWGKHAPGVFRITRGAKLAVAICTLSTAVCQGQLVINVGTFKLLPNASNQVVELLINNTGSTPISVDALNLNIQVADGGPEVSGVSPGAHIRGPHITAVDLLSGTAFEGDPEGQTDTGSAPQLALFSVTAPNGTVSLAPGSHRLALVTLDTTAPMDPGPWNFSLGNTLNGPTSYFVQGSPEIEPTILDGSLALAPAPAVTYTLLQGSRMADDWSNGGPPSVEAPLAGTFELETLPSNPLFALYQITNIAFAVGVNPSNPIYEVTGDGTWQFGLEVAQGQDAALEISFAGRSATLTNADRAITQPWPAITFTVGETVVHPANPPTPALTNTITLTVVAVPTLRFTSILRDPATGNVQLTWLASSYAVQLERAATAVGPFSPVATNLTATTFTDTTVPRVQSAAYYRLRLP